MKTGTEQQPLLKPEDERVLILTPTGRDSVMTARVLSASGLQCRQCADIHELCSLIGEGAGTLLVADEALTGQAWRQLLRALDEQESWSDLPLIVFPANGENAAVLLERLGSRANVTILERPVRIEILLNAAKSALRARKRQYDTRNLLVQLGNAHQQKDLFLATLSHELRTPLNAILGWSRLLQSGTLDSDKAATALRVIDRSATAQAQLISDILSVSQIVAGTLQIELIPVDLEAVVKAAIDALRPAAEAKDIHLECTFENAGWILGDTGRLQQIISNVVSNAIKFTPRKGRIHIHAFSSAADCQIVIRDTGKGIAASFLPHIFEHFRQGDSSFTRSQGGLGLGLAIVRRLVELHGGTVIAQSAGEGAGTTVTITLPVAAKKGEGAAGPAASVTRVLEGLRVLAVDDDPDSLQVVECVLQQYGATVVAVNSSAAALEALKTHRPDVLVSDIGMPGADGYELLRHVTAVTRGSPLRAIALTGYASQADKERAFQVGYHAHLSKPFEPIELVRSITQLSRAS